MNADIILLMAICYGVLGILLAIVLVRFAVYKFLGNITLYVIICYAICVVFAMYANYHPQPVEVDGVIIQPEYGDRWTVAATSFFDALKMMAVAFERDKIDAFIKSEEIANRIFGYGYIGASVIALIFTSLTVILAYARNIHAKLMNWLRGIFLKKGTVYLFTDSKVTITLRLAEELKKDGYVVITYLSRASQKTQEGTEFKDQFVGRSLDVRIEQYGQGIADLLFSRSQFPLARHIFKTKRYVYCLFSEDNTSISMADYFKRAVTKNLLFKTTKRGIIFDDKYRNNNGAIDRLYKALAFGNPDERVDAYRAVAEVLGLGAVINKRDFRVWRFARRYKISDDSLGYLISSFDKDVKRVINPNIIKVKKWIKRIENLNKTCEVKSKRIEALERFKVFITYHESDIDIINHYSDSTLQIVNTLSEYDMISSDFVLNNQITNFLNLQFDEKNKDCSIKEKINNDNMHVTFLGFGKINQPIFQKMTYAYQLWDDNENKVHYHILDRYADAYLESVKNIYTNKEHADNNKDKYFPFLYSVSTEEDGKDLTDYQTVEAYISEVFKDKNRFSKDGFEIFVVSVINTATSVQVALALRRAILKLQGNDNDKTRTLKTAIFVKISNTNVSRSFFSNSKFVKSQQDINDGLLLKEENRSEDTLAPIIPFGENALMSRYVSTTHKLLNEVGRTAQKAYDDTNRIKKSWLLSDKLSYLSNIMTAFSIKPKLALLNQRLDRGFHLVDKNFIEHISSLEEFRQREVNEVPLDYDKYSNNVKLLAALEHNRWLVSNYIIHQSGQMSFESFKNKLKIVNEKPIVVSKANGYANHVCMITNKGLEELRNQGLAHFRQMLKLENKSEEEINNNPTYLKALDRLYNLTLVYDIKAMMYAFDALESPCNKKERLKLEKAKRKHEQKQSKSN